MNIVSWNNIDIYTQSAIIRFLKAKSNLPIKFISAEFAKSGEEKYLAYFEDTKLTDFYKQIGKDIKGDFRIIVTPAFLQDEVVALDMAAKIPSDMDSYRKVILRIAYTILVNWQRAFIEAYKYVAQDKYAVTYNNAKKWYDTLK